MGEWRNLGAVSSDTRFSPFGGWGETGFLNGTYVVEVRAMPWRVFIPGTAPPPEPRRQAIAARARYQDPIQHALPPGTGSSLRQQSSQH